jgi:metal-dependent amidase/aminoacylase/carboxypeptidase family protein
MGNCQRYALKHLAQSHGAKADVHIVRGEPPVVNDQGMVRIVAEVVHKNLGEQALVTARWAALV